MGQAELGALPTADPRLQELLQSLRRGWRWAGTGAFAGILLAAGAVWGLPAKYEAVAYVQPGQLGQPGQVAPVPVETPHQTIERMGTGEFQLEVARVIGDHEWMTAIARSGGAATPPFQASVVKNTGRIELRVRHRTPAASKQLAEAVINGIARRHLDLAQPTINRLKHELSVVQEKRKAYEASYEELGKVLASARLSDQRFTQYSLATSARLSRESDVYALRQQELAIEVALSEPATQPAEAVEPIFVAENPVSPNVPAILMLGAVGGALLGLTASALRRRTV